MASPQTVDIEQLLAPVSGESPCGDNLRWDPLYDEIREARREDDKDALGADSPQQANWSSVINAAGDALAHRSKDLMLASYLTEALVQLHGFGGLRDGLRIINGLLETFWDGLYPQPDGEDLEPRAAPLVWLTEPDRGARLPNRVRDVPVAPGASDGRAYSWSFWKSRYVPPKTDAENSDTYARRKEEGEERAKLFEGAATAAPLAYYASLREDIAACQTEVVRLGTSVDQRFGRAAPGVSALKQSLDECAVLVGRIFKDKGGLDSAAEAGNGAAAEPTAAASGEAPAATTGPIKSRADALRRLEEVAAYFRQTEPHSPISYLVERATTWGTMSFEQLLAELVKDTSVRDQIGDLLGFRKKE